jgi:putative transcriptional regulator
MVPLHRFVLAAALCAAVLPLGARAQDEGVMLLVAQPAFRDLDYRETVLLVAPVPGGGYVGVIINRPTRRSLASLFPEHEPSKKVIDPVYYGGPFSRSALVALAHGHPASGDGSLPASKELYFAFRASTIDRIIETAPNSARYYVGYVGWPEGELNDEIEHGLWSVVEADTEIAFRKNTEQLWEELWQQTQRLHADRAAQLRRVSLPAARQ